MKVASFGGADGNVKVLIFTTEDFWRRILVVVIQQ